MNYNVPILSIVFMAISALAGIAIPVILFVIFRKKYKADIKPFFIGCGVFVLFAMILEQVLHIIVLSSDVGEIIKSNAWLFGIYGGLMAGIFEETGRFAAFKTVLKKNNEKDTNSLMYGAGHGGVEACIILLIAMISNIVVSLMINNQNIDILLTGAVNDAQRQALIINFETLANTPSEHFLMALVERIAAVAIHLSLSVLVWFAAKKGGKSILLYPLAILLHTLANAVSVILANYVSNMWIVEGVLYLITACLVIIAIKVWRNHHISNCEAAENGQGDSTA
jgi:uncharacterized membrane protein YhfC